MCSESKFPRVWSSLFKTKSDVLDMPLRCNVSVESGPYFLMRALPEYTFSSIFFSPSLSKKSSKLKSHVSEQRRSKASMAKAEDL